MTKRIRHPCWKVLAVRRVQLETNDCENLSFVNVGNYRGVYKICEYSKHVYFVEDITIAMIIWETLWR